MKEHLDMTRQSFEQQWDQLRQKYSVYLRLLEAIPANRYHTRIVPGMGTPAQLAVQMSAAIVRDITQGVANGEIKREHPSEARIVADMGTKMAVIAYARKCWNLADDAVNHISVAHLNATIPTPWNLEIPGWVGFNILNDEFLHHYGQLSTYARLCGAEPPFLWGFAESARQYRFAD